MSTQPLASVRACSRELAADGEPRQSFSEVAFPSITAGDYHMKVSLSLLPFPALGLMTGSLLSSSLHTTRSPQDCSQAPALIMVSQLEAAGAFVPQAW